jgi:hypothetical protein
VTIGYPAPESGAGPRGIVVARQLGRAPRLRVRVSLHDGKANTRYRVMETRRGCSRTVSGATGGVWKMSVEFDDEGNAYARGRPDRRGPLRGVRAVRVYERGDGGKFVQRACGVITGTYDSGTGVLT